jgi:hypothetical protein
MTSAVPSLRRRHSVDSSFEQQQKLLQQEGDQAESAPLPTKTPESLPQTSCLRAPPSFASLASRSSRSTSLEKWQISSYRWQAGAMLCAAAQKSKDLAPDAPTAWQDLANFCEALNIDFSILVDGVPNAIETVLRSRDWESVIVLANILPCRRYFFERISRSDDGSFGFYKNDEVGPARIIHPDGCYIYCGDWAGGDAEGDGTIVYSNGNSYSGEFKKSLYHGYGTYKNKETGKTYPGSFQKGKIVNSERQNLAKEEDHREIIKLWDVVSANNERKINMEASTRAIVAAVVAGTAVTWPTEVLSKLLSVDFIRRIWCLFPIEAGLSAVVNIYGLVDSALSRKVYYAAANTLEDDGYPEAAVKRSQEYGVEIKFPTRQETEDLARMASWKPGHPTSLANAATKRTNALREDLRELHQESNDLFRKKVELSAALVGAVVGTLWLAISAEQSCRSVAASASVAASLCGVRYVGLAVPAWAALSALRDIVQNHRFDLIRDPKMSALLASGYSKAEIMQEFEATRPRYDKALSLKSWWVGRIGQLVNGRGPITQSMLNEWTRNVFLLKSKDS